MRRISMTVFAIFVIIAPTAYAQNIDASDPYKIAGLMRERGWDTEMTFDDDGDPQIKSRASQSNFRVWFC